MPPLTPAGDGADREPHATTRAQPARVPLPMGARGILHRRLRKDAILQTSSVYVCTSNAAARHSGRHASTWQEHSTGLEWMRFSRETHLLLYGTSHLQAVAGALRVAARHLGTLTRTETLSHSNFCGANTMEPPDTSCEAGGGPKKWCSWEMSCGPEHEACDLHMASIVRDHLSGGSSITTVSNHAQSQFTAKATNHWLARLTHSLGRNFSHGAFMVPHDAAWMEAQCMKYRSNGSEMPDPDLVGDRVEPCGDGDGPECPSKDARFRAVSRWVRRPLATVIRPAFDPIPNSELQLALSDQQRRRASPGKGHTPHVVGLTCVTDRQLAQPDCGGVRNSTVWLSQALAPELAPSELVGCDCGSHLCAGKCAAAADGQLQCSPAEGMAAAWMVLRAVGLA